MRETFSDKIDYLNERQYNEVLHYLKDKLNNTYIEILGEQKTKLMDLYNTSKLMGWCWQTSETAILFLEDDDCIERGYLDIDTMQHNYYHAWISFKYKDQEYVFDPCFQLTCLKEDYINEFKVQTLAQVKASDVKELFINRVLNYKPKEKKDSFIRLFMSDQEYETYRKKHENEVIIHAKEDINEPFYRSGAGYQANIENNKIKQLSVHYYYTDC